MGLNSLLFLVGESFRNIRRNGLVSLAALGTVTVALTVLGAVLMTAYRVSEIVEHQPQKFNMVDIFLSPQAERTTTLAVMARISRLPDAGTVRLVSKETAWAEVQADQPGLADALTENPLPDKIEVEAVSAERLEALAARLSDRTAFAEVDAVRTEGRVLAAMLNFARLVKIIGGFTACALSIATLFIVANTIRLTLFARRREIRTMQLVGATSGFIRIPLLLEGVFHGVMGALLADSILLLCGREVARLATRFHSPLVGDVPSHLSPLILCLSLVSLGALIGLAGSYLSLRRFLKPV